MTDKHQSRQSSPAPLMRGQFTDGHTIFAVHASTIQEAPDAFHVSVKDNPADVVLIVSGITTGQLHATWGQDWRVFASDWKRWVKDAAFQVFYTGHNTNGPNGGVPGKVRFCNG